MTPVLRVVIPGRWRWRYRRRIGRMLRDLPAQIGNAIAGAGAA